MIRALLQLLQSLLDALSPPYDTGWIAIQFTTQGTAYTANDAYGFKGDIPIPKKSGVLMTARHLDLSDQGAGLVIFFFDADITATTDNAALALTDPEGTQCLGHVTIAAADHADAGTWRSGTTTNINLPIRAPQGKIYFQCMTLGTPTVTAGQESRLRFFFQ